MKMKCIVFIILAFPFTTQGADYQPDQEINDVRAYKDSDGYWHINSTWYCPMKVTYRVSNISLSAIDENGRFPEEINSILIQRKQNISVGVPTKNGAVSVGILKVEYAHSDSTAGEGDSSSLSRKSDSGNDATTENVVRLSKTLSLKRSQSSSRVAFGSVFVNGKFVCYFMERATGGSLFNNGNFDGVFQFTADGATINVGGNIEQLQFSTKLNRNEDGSFSAVDSDGSQPADDKLTSELGLSQAGVVVSLPTEVGNFPSAESFQQ